MNSGLAKSACLVLFVAMTFLFLICVVAELKWATVSVLDAMKLDWNASQSAAVLSREKQTLVFGFGGRVLFNQPTR
jgi:hypothetical protein